MGIKSQVINQNSHVYSRVTLNFIKSALDDLLFSVIKDLEEGIIIFWAVNRG